MPESKSILPVVQPTKPPKAKEYTYSNSFQDERRATVKSLENATFRGLSKR